MYEAEYVYRIPRNARIATTAALAVPPFAFAVAVIALDPSWLLAWATLPVFFLASIVQSWILSRPIVIIDSEKIRWPIRFTELRWEEVESAQIVRLLWTEYARVRTKRGGIRRIWLERVGGAEYRRRVLAGLRLV